MAAKQPLTTKAAHKNTNKEKTIICYKCGKEGHIKLKCLTKKEWKAKEKRDSQKSPSKRKNEDKLLLATSLATGSFVKNS